MAGFLTGWGDRYGVTGHFLEPFIKIVDNITLGLHMIDGSGHSVLVNNAWSEITQLDPWDVLGLHVSDMVRKGIFSRTATEVAMRTRKPEVAVEKAKSGVTVVVYSIPVSVAPDLAPLFVCEVRPFFSQLPSVYASNSDAMSDPKETLYLPEDIVVPGPHTQRIFETLHRVARYRVPVLIEGETGVGKEVAARLVHEWSPRRRGPLIRINCGAIPSTLAESEFFGYAPGAFTGAGKYGKPGLFKMADGGTIFLDEVTEISHDVQVKLLRVLQDGEVWPIGAKRPIQVDLRVVCASNSSIEECVKTGKMRRDLFYRLNVINVKIPPLRDRPEEIPALASHFIAHLTKEYGIQKEFDPDVIQALMGYSWPGNIRELRNVIERMILSSEHPVVSLKNLPDEIRNDQIFAAGSGGLRDALQSLERRLIFQAVREHGSLRRAAKSLGLDHSTLARKFRRYSQERV